MGNPAAEAKVAPLGNDPIVTIAIPMLNELGAIEACLDSFAAQDYPHSLLDVLVIDGGSTDGSRRYVEQRALEEPWVRVIDNRVGSAAAAFNLGASEGRGEVVCLFSSHGVPATDYVSRSVKVLHETGVVGVCGKYHHIGKTPVSSAIGAAMVSPFGMASSHRMADTRQKVDTISHPAYIRQGLLEVGGFDESLARNSDYEINIRLRQAGHELVFDPSIESIYRPRPGLKALGKQFWHYGRWKARVAQLHPGHVKPRHMAAPLLAIGAVLTPAAFVANRFTRLIAGSAWLAYLVGCGLATAKAAKSAQSQAAESGGAKPSIRALFGAFPTMHLSWGAGFVTSLVEDLTNKKNSERKA